MPYEFELGHNDTKAIKNIFCAKKKSAIDHSNQIVQEVLFGLQGPW